MSAVSVAEKIIAGLHLNGEAGPAIASIEAEQAVVGGLLVDPGALDRVAPIIAPADLYRADHRAIFRAVQAVAASGVSPDVITVHAHLDAHDQLDEAGGLGYIGELAHNTPSTAAIENWAELVAQAAQRRRLIALGHDLAERARAPGADVDALAGTFIERMQDATRATTRSHGFALLPASDVLTEPTPPRYAITPLFELGALVDVFGPPDSLKSFVALSWLYAAASGQDWHNARAEAGACAYMAGEGLAGIGRRIKAQQIVRGPVGDLHVSRTAAALLDDAAFAQVLVALERLADRTGGLRMVAVDTMARFMAPGDENSTRDMGEFVSRLDRLRDRLGCTVIVVCHSGHMTADRQRGSSAWGAALDTSIRVERPSTTENVVRITCAKQKDAPRFEPLLLRFAPVELPWLDADGNACTSLVLDTVEQAGPPAVAAGHGLGKRQRDALRVLGGLYRDHRERVEQRGGDRREARVEIQELRRVANLDRRRWSEISGALAERGLVTVEQGFIYLTETGELAAQ